jgi:hypothetical protein
MMNNICQRWKQIWTHCFLSQVTTGSEYGPRWHRSYVCIAQSKPVLGAPIFTNETSFLCRTTDNRVAL